MEEVTQNSKMETKPSRHPAAMIGLYIITLASLAMLAHQSYSEDLFHPSRIKNLKVRNNSTLMKEQAETNITKQPTQGEKTNHQDSNEMIDWVKPPKYSESSHTEPSSRLVHRENPTSAITQPAGTEIAEITTIPNLLEQSIPESTPKSLLPKLENLGKLATNLMDDQFNKNLLNHNACNVKIRNSKNGKYLTVINPQNKLNRKYALKEINPVLPQTWEWSLTSSNPEDDVWNTASPRGSQAVNILEAINVDFPLWGINGHWTSGYWFWKPKSLARLNNTTELYAAIGELIWIDPYSWGNVIHLTAEKDDTSLSLEIPNQHLNQEFTIEFEEAQEKECLPMFRKQAAISKSKRKKRHTPVDSWNQQSMAMAYGANNSHYGWEQMGEANVNPIYYEVELLYPPCDAISRYEYMTYLLEETKKLSKAIEAKAKTEVANIEANIQRSVGRFSRLTKKYSRYMGSIHCERLGGSLAVLETAEDLKNFYSLAQDAELIPAGFTAEKHIGRWINPDSGRDLSTIHPDWKNLQVIRHSVGYGTQDNINTVKIPWGNPDYNKYYHWYQMYDFAPFYRTKPGHNIDQHPFLKIVPVIAEQGFTLRKYSTSRSSSEYPIICQNLIKETPERVHMQQAKCKDLARQFQTALDIMTPRLQNVMPNNLNSKPDPAGRISDFSRPNTFIPEELLSSNDFQNFHYEKDIKAHGLDQMKQICKTKLKEMRGHPIRVKNQEVSRQKRLLGIDIIGGVFYTALTLSAFANHPVSTDPIQDVYIDTWEEEYGKEADKVRNHIRKKYQLVATQEALNDVMNNNIKMIELKGLFQTTEYALNNVISALENIDKMVMRKDTVEHFKTLIERNEDYPLRSDMDGIKFKNTHTKYAYKTTIKYPIQLDNHVNIFKAHAIPRYNSTHKIKPIPDNQYVGIYQSNTEFVTLTEQEAMTCIDKDNECFTGSDQTKKEEAECETKLLFEGIDERFKENLQNCPVEVSTDLDPEFITIEKTVYYSAPKDITVHHTCLKRSEYIAPETLPAGTGTFQLKERCTARIGNVKLRPKYRPRSSSNVTKIDFSTKSLASPILPRAQVVSDTSTASTIAFTLGTILGVIILSIIIKLIVQYIKKRMKRSNNGEERQHNMDLQKITTMTEHNIIKQEPRQQPQSSIPRRPNNASTQIKKEQHLSSCKHAQGPQQSLYSLPQAINSTCLTMNTIQPPKDMKNTPTPIQKRAEARQ